MGLTLSIASVVASVIGTVVSTTTSIVGANQQQNQAEANAKSQQDMLDYNARQEQREAETVLAENNEAARRQRLEDERIKSLQRASYGKSGVAIASGSPLAVLGDAAANMEMGVQDTHRTGARQYSQRMAQSNSFMYQGRVARGSVGKGSLITGVGGAIGSSLNAGGKIAMSGASYYK